MNNDRYLQHTDAAFRAWFHRTAIDGMSQDGDDLTNNEMHSLAHSDLQHSGSPWWTWWRCFLRSGTADLEDPQLRAQAAAFRQVLRDADGPVATTLRCGYPVLAAYAQGTHMSDRVGRTLSLDQLLSKISRHIHEEALCRIDMARQQHRHDSTRWLYVRNMNRGQLCARQRDPSAAVEFGYCIPSLEAPDGTRVVNYIDSLNTFLRESVHIADALQLARDKDVSAFLCWLLSRPNDEQECAMRLSVACRGIIQRPLAPKTTADFYYHITALASILCIQLSSK
jgi:hypothetical protein